MAERRSRESTWRYGWPSIIAVGVVVVASGFVVGVIAGITWEEPGLVVGYLSGQTEGINWGVEAEGLEAGDLAADGAISEPPSVAAPPPLGRRKVPDAAVSDRARSGAGVASARPAGGSRSRWAHSRRRVPHGRSRIPCARTATRCICLRRRVIRPTGACGSAPWARGRRRKRRRVGSRPQRSYRPGC